MKKLFLIPFSLFLAACSLVGVRSGTEQTGYRVEQSLDGGIELRLYEERVYAETVVSRSDDGHRSAAFRALFDYISGGNAPADEIAMTTPVSSSLPGTEIAMTAPVQTSGGDDSYRMRFFLPETYRMETAPKPLDARVRLGAVPPRREAVLRFTGSTSDAAVEASMTKLLDGLARDGWRAAGEPVAYFYDPPWTLPFLRRNEVAVTVEKPPA